ncbi:MAG: hypothetical protein WC456_02715 [Patescibacteria group bacterium]
MADINYNTEDYRNAFLAATPGGEEERKIFIAWDEYALWQLSMVGTIPEIEGIYFNSPEKGRAREAAEKKLLVLRYARAGVKLDAEIYKQAIA